MADYGLGKRKRADVTYKEQLSEQQWLKYIEAGRDPQQELAKRKQAGINDDADMPHEDSDRLVSGVDSENSHNEDDMSGEDFVLNKKNSRRRNK